jgi:c-di-GMP-binding flagellar brake protein YcgR
MRMPAVEPEIPVGVDRRRHQRYRRTAPITIYLSDGTAHRAMSIEISESGMSVATGVSLTRKQKVHLEPVADSIASAEVRHIQENFCGFEFLNLSEAQVDRIRQDCRTLPIFKTTIDI